jgi:hypothetical protein
MKTNIKKLLSVTLLMCLTLTFASCVKDEILNEQAKQKLPAINPVEQPYTYLQNKYLDLVLEYEFDKQGRIYDLSKMELVDKIDTILKIDERKNAENALAETIRDSVFYSGLYNQFLLELDTNKLIADFISKNNYVYQADEMTLRIGETLINKFEILKTFEESDKNEMLKLVRYTALAKWGKTIKYRLDNAINSNTNNLLVQGMASWEAATNNKITFKKIANNCGNKFVWAIGCSYHIYITTTSDNVNGYSTLCCKPWAKIQVNQDNIDKHGAQHELGHQLGLQHEHQRPDRDDYINVYLNNIPDEWEYAFKKLSSVSNKTYGAFDFSSVMIYWSTAFANSGTNSMTKKSDGSTWGRSTDLSPLDKEKIKQIYN